ncbi:hypothetical protein CEXT_322671 [Caerostris extrusa]|uniref:Uncharacterized protein n=1 Tax=Caerostris extrusa TaxID=172846 RepID=A0AAV4VTR8_CAEEX|nr:hypothetical protein CEXT_322671 [Caerostris extrusa]
MFHARGSFSSLTQQVAASLTCATQTIQQQSSGSVATCNKKVKDSSRRLFFPCYDSDYNLLDVIYPVKRVIQIPLFHGQRDPVFLNLRNNMVLRSHTCLLSFQNKRDMTEKKKHLASMSLLPTRYVVEDVKTLVSAAWNSPKRK